MCGINGYITSKEVKLSPTNQKIRANIAKGLLIANQSRGVDSTGVFLQNGKYHVLSKDTCYASKFVRSKDIIKAFKKDSHLMLGHTRQATQGLVTKNNAHPFIKGNIVGIHNGVIFNDDDIAKEHGYNTIVDSEVIFELLNEYDNDFKKAFKEIRGSASIAWMDIKNPKTLYVIAHDNPLTIAQVPSLKTTFFTSEFVSMDAILQSAIGNENYSVWEVKEDMVYTINQDQTMSKTKVEFSSFTSSTWDSKDKKWVNGKGWVDKDTPDEKEKSLDDDMASAYENPIKTLDDVLDKEEIDFIKEMGKKEGCTTCKIPLHRYCYYDEELSNIYCYRCTDENNKQFPYVYINLDNGSSHYMLSDL